jgi:arylsulfatase
VAGTALLGCTPSEPDRLAWRRHDLWSLPNKRDKPVEKVVAYLGGAAARDLPRGTGPALRAAAPAVSAGEIHAIEQIAGQTLRWQLALGREAYFSFLPLRTVGWDCRCTYRVALLDAAGTRHELHRAIAEEMTPPAPAVVTIDLAAWADQAVELILDLDAPDARTPPPRGLWASPAVWGRFPLDAERARGEARAERPNILLLGLDTLRADALGAWGRTPSVTPTLDALAAESDVYLDAFTVFNVTNPSFISMMTGLYGKHHGSYTLKTPVGPEAVTLAEQLAAAGYATKAVLSARHLGDHNSGLGQGFGDVAITGGQYAAELAVDTLLDWLAGRERRAGAVADSERADSGAARPFFAWLHLFDPHTPHTPPRPYALGYAARERAGLSAAVPWTHFRTPGPVPFAEPVLLGAHELYAGEVAYLDRQLDRLLGFLESRDLLANTMIVVVADHGENLEDHGVRYRHAGLWDTTTHVPMMIRWPGSREAGQAPSSRRLSGLVQTIDLFPTILEAAGLSVPPQDGESLRQLFADGRQGRRVVFADHADGLGSMVRTRTHKLFTSQGNPFVPDGNYLYDLVADPGELENLAGRGLPIEAELTRILDAFQRDLRTPVAAQKERELDPEEAKRLEALGYL